MYVLLETTIIVIDAEKSLFDTTDHPVAGAAEIKPRKKVHTHACTYIQYN